MFSHCIINYVEEHWEAAGRLVSWWSRIFVRNVRGHNSPASVRIRHIKKKKFCKNIRLLFSAHVHVTENHYGLLVRRHTFQFSNSCRGQRRRKLYCHILTRQRQVLWNRIMLRSCDSITSTYIQICAYFHTLFLFGSDNAFFKS